MARGPASCASPNLYLVRMVDGCEVLYQEFRLVFLLGLLKYGDFEQLAAFDLRDLHCRGSMTLRLHNENSV